jgi:hypothetical protein
MPQYIYDIFCWNGAEITGIKKQFALCGSSIDDAKQRFFNKYAEYLITNKFFQYANYRYVYKYECEPTGVCDARNHMIYRPLYNYHYMDLLTLIREREPCRVIDCDLLIM